MIIVVVVSVATLMLRFQSTVTQANPDAKFTIAKFSDMLAIGVVWRLAYALYVSDYSR